LFSNPCWLFHRTITIIVYRAQEVGVIDMNLLWIDSNYWTYPESKCKQNSISLGTLTDHMLDVALLNER
jgi:hypothetical protein